VRRNRARYGDISTQKIRPVNDNIFAPGGKALIFNYIFSGPVYSHLTGIRHRISRIRRVLIVRLVGSLRTFRGKAPIGLQIESGSFSGVRGPGIQFVPCVRSRGIRIYFRELIFPLVLQVVVKKWEINFFLIEYRRLVVK